MITDQDETPKGDANVVLSPVLARVVLRGLLRSDTIVTRDEAMELLPPCCSRHWFDENVKSKQVAFVGGRALYRWGDVLASLSGERSPATPEGPRYLTVDEAAVYLRYASTNALRMAVARKQILPSARRGRAPLFTREDLDRQVSQKGVSLTPAPETSASLSPPSAVRASADTAVPSGGTQSRQRAEREPAESADEVHDPFGLRAAVARARGEPWPPPLQDGDAAARLRRQRSRASRSSRHASAKRRQFEHRRWSQSGCGAPLRA